MRSNNHTPLHRAKMRARELRVAQSKSGQQLSHSQALEQVAKELGYRNWNTAAALLSNYPDISIQVGDHVHGTYLKQPFTGRVLSVTEQGGGAYLRVTLDLDEAVDVVTFDSFSAFRKRINGQIDSKGDSPAKTSDGEPHLSILGHVHS
jgi:hypothetical protein